MKLTAEQLQKLSEEDLGGAQKPNSLTYSEKLKDPRWQKVRLKTFERDNWKCTLCGDEKTTLHVHHEEYKGEPWEANPKKLKTVCETCHVIAEYYQKYTIVSLIKGGREGNIYFINCVGRDEIFMEIVDKATGNISSPCYFKKSSIKDIMDFFKKATNG